MTDTITEPHPPPDGLEYEQRTAMQTLG
jgi:hypothetical protein